MSVKNMLFHKTIIPINSSEVPLEENKKVLLKSEDNAIGYFRNFLVTTTCIAEQIHFDRVPKFLLDQCQ